MRLFIFLNFKAQFSPLTEKEIIQGCIEGDIQTQRLLFNTFAPKMMSVCLRYIGNRSEAEDVLQDGFILVFRHIDKFKFNGSFEGWIRRIMVNTALKFLQSKKVNFVEIDAVQATFIHGEPSVLSELNTEELMKMIDALPDGYKIVFNLYVIEGYSHDEIAKLIHISPGTSRSQLIKARRLLQKQITERQKLAV